jgi:hypothetical protein
MSDAIPSLPKGGEVGPKEAFSGVPIDPFVPPMPPPVGMSDVALSASPIMGAGIHIQDLTPPMQRTDTHSAEPPSISEHTVIVAASSKAVAEISDELAGLQSRMQKIERWFSSGDELPPELESPDPELGTDDDDLPAPPRIPRRRPEVPVQEPAAPVAVEGPDEAPQTVLPKPGRIPPADQFIPSKLMDVLRLIGDELGVDVDALMDEPIPARQSQKKDDFRAIGEDAPRQSGRYRAMGESLDENNQQIADEAGGDGRAQTSTRRMGEDAPRQSGRYRAMGESLDENNQQLADESGKVDRSPRRVRRMGESRRGNGNYRAMGESRKENDDQKKAELEAEQNKEKEKWTNAEQVREIEWRLGSDEEEFDNLLFSFKVRIEANETTGDPEVVVAPGYRCVIDSNWELINETNLGAVGSGGTVYIRRTYPTVDERGVICEPGEWGNLIYVYGSPTATDTLGFTIRIATVDANGVVTQEHLGNIAVFDVANCTGDPCE